jgi:hypothetical protein
MELNLKTQQNKLISLFRVSLMFFLFCATDSCQ